MLHIYLQQFAVSHTLHIYVWCWIFEIFAYLILAFESWRTLPQTLTKILDPVLIQSIHPARMFPFVAFIIEIMVNVSDFLWLSCQFTPSDAS